MLKKIENHLLNGDRCPICNEKLEQKTVDLISGTVVLADCGNHYNVNLEFLETDMDFNIYSDLIIKDHTTKYIIDHSFSMHVKNLICSSENINIVLEFNSRLEDCYNVLIKDDGEGFPRDYLFLDLSKIKFPISEEKLLKKIKTIKIYS